MTALRLMLGIAVAFYAATTGAAQAPDEVADPVLMLDEVLESVELHYPLLRAAEAGRVEAEGERRSALGAFDLRLGSEGDLRPVGFYQNYANDTFFEQPTRLWGARFFGGYRVGLGNSFPSYEGNRKTDLAGEVRGGVELPLLRGGPIDDERAELRRAELDLERVDFDIALQRIDFVRGAKLRYWGWTEAGLAVEVAELLLQVAELRQSQIEGRVRRGALPRIDLVDNQRLIVDRRVRLRGAERDLEQAAIALSLFLRDANGQPLPPGRERLPADFPAERLPDAATLEADRAFAGSSHPLLRSFALRREALEVEQDLARNDLLPGLDLRLEGSTDLGTPVEGIDTSASLSFPNDEPIFKALIRFDLPVQRREARGRLVAATARVERLDQQASFARERILAEIQRALAGLEAAFAQTAGARENLDLARQLQRAEERKLELGNSNLLNVNIRELQAAEAALSLISAQAAFFRALAEYEAAVGSS